MNLPIPMADPARQYAWLGDELATVVQDLLASGRYIGGEAVETFEADLANFLGLDAPCVITCANGTDALELAYLAIGLEAGDEVIIPTHNYVAAAESAVRLGLKPVWADVADLGQSRRYNIDPHGLEPLLSPRTRAVVAVNLYGLPCDALRLRTWCEMHGLVFIEDNAQGLGGFAEVEGSMVPMGRLGHISTTSFFPTKPLGCAGDGGAIVTDNPLWASRARCLAHHGQGDKYDYKMIGRNSRLDALQAKILSVKLGHLSAFVQMQRTIAERYTAALCLDSRLTLPDAGRDLPTYHQYTLLLDASISRERVRHTLIDRGVSSGLYYPQPLHRYAVYAERSRTASSLERSEDLSRRMLSLPIFPLMTEAEQDYVLEQLKHIIGYEG